MFDPVTYRNACDRLTLGQEKLEEMISMTEERRQKGFGRPVRTALIAATLAGAMCVTAAAAGSGALERLLMTATVAYVMGEGEDIPAVTTLPNVEVVQADGRTTLVVDGAALDITEELEREGSYLYRPEAGAGSFDVLVQLDGTYLITVYGEDGAEVLKLSSEEIGGEAPVYTVAEDGEEAADSFTSIEGDDGTCYVFDVEQTVKSGD